MNELLLVVGAIFVLCAVIGATKGFIKIVAALLTTLVIMVAVVIATPHVGNMLKQFTPIEKMVESRKLYQQAMIGIPTPEFYMFYNVS